MKRRLLFPAAAAAALQDLLYLESKLSTLIAAFLATR
jgi:hypothetical protein